MNSATDQRWGLWAVMAWTATIAVLFVLVQSAVAILSVRLSAGDASDAELELLYERAATDGDVLGLATLASALVCSVLVALAVMWKHRGQVVDYLALRPSAPTVFVRWGVLLIILLIVLDAAMRGLGQAPTPEVMHELFRSTDSKLLLFVATVLAAPIFEELFFRGFLLRGLQDSWFGSVGAVVITAAIWSVIHLQYDAFGMATIFAIGLFLGIARLRSGSTLLAVFLHALNNGIAFAFMMMLAEGA